MTQLMRNCKTVPLRFAIRVIDCIAAVGLRFEDSICAYCTEFNP